MSISYIPSVNAYLAIPSYKIDWETISSWTDMFTGRREKWILVENWQSFPHNTMT